MTALTLQYNFKLFRMALGDLLIEKVIVFDIGEHSFSIEAALFSFLYTPVWFLSVYQPAV